MILTRKSPFTGETNTLDVPCTEAEYEAWRNGALIQNAMPNVDADMREFVMTGITPSDWYGAFSDSD